MYYFSFLFAIRIKIILTLASKKLIRKRTPITFSAAQQAPHTKTAGKNIPAQLADQRRYAAAPGFKIFQTQLRT